MTSYSTDLAYANGISQNIAQPFFLPNTIGTIVERYQGTGKEKIILIQDLHCDPAVQHNIQSIIHVAKDTYGDALTMIGIEGTPTGRIDTSLLASIPNKIIRMNVADHFVQQGDVSGGELFVIGYGNGSVHACGLEDANLYRQDFNAFYTSLSYRDEIQTVSNNIRNGIAYVKPYLYTKEALEIEAMGHAYTTHSIDTATYLMFLTLHAKQYDISIEQTYPHIAHVLRSLMLKKKLNYTMLNNEMNDITKTVFPKLTKEQRIRLAHAKTLGIDVYYKYLFMLLSAHQLVISSDFTYTKEYGMYVDTVQAIDDLKVIEEYDTLKYQLLFRALQNRTDGLHLAQTERYVTLMEEYICNQASERGTEEWRSMREKMYAILHDISNRMLQNNYFDDNETMIKNANNTMDVFYEDAVKRNEILAQNMIEQSRSCNSRVSVCIIGGFHREGIANILKSKGISYDVVLPCIEKEYDNHLYIRRIHEQAQQYGISLKHNTSISPYRNAMMVETRCGTPTFGHEVLDELCATLEATKDINAIQSFFTEYSTRLGGTHKVTITQSADQHCTVTSSQYNYTHTFISEWYTRVQTMRISSAFGTTQSKKFAADFIAAYTVNSTTVLPYCMNIFDGAAEGNQKCARVLRDISLRNRDVISAALDAYRREHTTDRIASVVRTMTLLDDATTGTWAITRWLQRIVHFILHRLLPTIFGIPRYFGMEYRTGTDQAAKMLYMLGITQIGRQDAAHILNELWNMDATRARNVLARMYSFDANRASKKIQWQTEWVTEFQKQLNSDLLRATTKRGRVKIVAIMVTEIIILAVATFLAYYTAFPLTLLILAISLSAFCVDDLLRTLLQSHQWLRKWVSIASLVAFCIFYAITLVTSIITAQMIIIVGGLLFGAALTVITSEYPRFSFLWQRKNVVADETAQANEDADKVMEGTEFSEIAQKATPPYIAHILYQLAMKDSPQVHGMDKAIEILQSVEQPNEILRQMYMLHDTIHPDIAWPEKRLLEFEKKIPPMYETALNGIKSEIRRKKMRTYIIAALLGVCFYALLMLFVFTNPMLLIVELIAGIIIFLLAKADRQIRRMIMVTGSVIFAIGATMLLLGSPLGVIIGSYGIVFAFCAWYAESSTTGFFRGTQGKKGWKQTFEIGSLLFFAFGVITLVTLFVAGIFNPIGLLIGTAILGAIGIGIVLFPYIRQRIQHYNDTKRRTSPLGTPLLNLANVTAVFLGPANTLQALAAAGYQTVAAGAAEIGNTVLQFIKTRPESFVAASDARTIVNDAFSTQHMTVSVRDIHGVSLIVTEPETVATPTGATSYFSSGMMTLLERLHGILSGDIFQQLAHQIAVHEETELRLIREGKTAQTAHDEALAIAGPLQHTLYDSMEHINQLQLLEYQITQQHGVFDYARAQEMWTHVTALQTGLTALAGRVVTNDEIFAQLFRGLQEAYRNGIERYPQEIVISLNDVSGADIPKHIEKFGVLEAGKLRANVRVVLVGDIARYDDPTAVAAAATTLERLYTHRGTGSDLVWVLGTTALETANENTRQGTAVRTLLTKGIGQTVTVLADGSLATSGFVDDTMLAEIARVHQGQRDVHSVADVLNTALEFRARAINVAGIEVLVSPDRALTHIPHLSVDEIRRLLDLSTTLIYGDHGLVNNTDPTNYAAAHAALRQVAFNIAAAIPPELVSIATADGAIVRRHNVLPTGAVLMETVSRDFRGREQHIDIRVVARPVTTLWMTSTADMMMRRVMSLTHIMIGISVVEPLKVGDVVEFMFGDEATDRERIARYQALSAAA